jgi:hypothetical protein
MVKHCCHGLCKSDTKIDPSRKFLPFPKPKRHPEKARRWIELCGRENFTVANITKWTYICDKHFPCGVNLDHHVNQSLEPFPVHDQVEPEQV